MGNQKILKAGGFIILAVVFWFANAAVRVHTTDRNARSFIRTSYGELQIRLNSSPYEKLSAVSQFLLNPFRKDVTIFYLQHIDRNVHCSRCPHQPYRWLAVRCDNYGNWSIKQLQLGGVWPGG